MRHHRRTWTRSWTGLGLSLGLVLAAPASASDPSDETPPTKRAAEILDHVDWETPPEAKTDLFSRFGIDKHQGLAYRRSGEVAGRRVEWGVYGPVQRRKTFGLGFKLKF